MKKAPPVRLSLRKLFIAMLAVGPVAILPSPVFAALPSYNSGTNSGSFVVTNGSVATTTGTGVIQSSDRAVLVWGVGNFNIASGETFNFQVPGGSVLNKVGYTTAGTGALVADNATIAGTLISSGRVFVLANGNISLSGSANISTQGGLVLTTLAETSDFNYTTTGSLALNGTPQGNISLGNSGTPQLFVSNGGLSAYANNVSVNNIKVTGDLVVANRGANVGLVLTGPTVTINNVTTVGTTEVTGNLNASTNNGSITQGGSNTALLVSGTTMLNTGGNNTITLLSTTTTNNVTTTLNDFGTVMATTGSASSASIDDKNSIVLGSSTVGNLTVNVVNNITTSGAVAASGSVSLNSRDTSVNTNKVDFGSGSSVGGTFTANVANGTVTANTVGNLTTGLVTTGGGPLDAVIVTSGGAGYTGSPTVVITGGGGTGATGTAIVSGGVVTGVNITNAGTGYTSAPTVVFQGGGPNPTSAATATVRISSSVNAAPNTVINTTLSGGAGYDMNFLPAVIVTGGGGSGATVVGGWVNGVLTNVTIVSQGSGYTSAPTIALNGVAGVDYPTPVVPIGNIPLALAPVGIVSANVTGGSGYTSAPTITISGTGTGASASSAYTQPIGALPVVNYTINNPGSNYTTSPTATVSGGGTAPSSSASASLTSAPNGGNVSITTTGIATINGNINGGNIVVTAPSINAISGTVASNGTVTYNATGGNLVVGTTNARSLALTVAGGNITQSGVLSHISNGVTTPTTVINATSSGNITLTSANNLKGIVQTNGKEVALANTGSIILGTTTVAGNLTVNTTSTGSSITLGTGAGTAAQNLTIGGNMNLNTVAGLVTDDIATAQNGAYASVSVFGSTNIVTNGGNALANNGGAVTLDAARLNASAGGQFGATGRYGQLNVDTRGVANGAITLSENTAMNVGNVTAGSAAVTIRSVNSDVVMNGLLSTTGAINVQANLSISQGANGVINAGSGAVQFETANTAGTSVKLSNPANTFGSGVVRIHRGRDNLIVSNTSITANIGETAELVTTPTVITTLNPLNGDITLGNVAGPGNGGDAPGFLQRHGDANEVVLNSAAKVLIRGGTYRNLTITANSTDASSISHSNMFAVTNTLTLNTAGGITLNQIASNTTASFNNVVLGNITGNSVIYSSRDMTVRGNSAGTVELGVGMGSNARNSYVNPWTLTLGNLNVANLTAIASNHGSNDPLNGTSGIIRQVAGSNIHVEKDASFRTFNNDITIANNGNSFGKVSIATGGAAGTAGAGNVTLTEDAALRIGDVRTNGTLTLTSRFGSILEDASGAAVNVSAPKALATLSAPNGSVALGGSTNGGMTTGDISAVTITAAGAAQVVSTNNVVLGAINANSLLVTSGNLISQSAPVRIYGTSVFNSQGGILLTDAGNNFGPITANVGSPTVGGSGLNKNISIVEAGTLNLRSVYMPGGGNGTFTANSLGGDIIDTGLAGVKLGGASTGSSTGMGTGLVSLTAAGNIMIDDPTSDFLSTAGIAFKGTDVTLSVLGNNSTALILGAVGVASSASGNLIASNALGSIANAGAFTVGGNAYFQAANAALGSGNIVINQPGVGFGTLKFIGQQVNIAEAGNMDILTGSSSTGIAQLNSGGAISVVDVGGTVTFGSTSSFVASSNITLTKLQAQNTVTVNSAGTKDLSALSLAGNLNSKTPVDLGTGAGPSTNPALAPKP